jgi:ABC-2 type transport system ATP-binding protein
MAKVKIPQVVRVQHVAKRFILRKDDSLKERIVTFGRRGRKFREEFWALNDVDFSIEAGTTVGLIGHNGSGKSTLLKVIGGIITPTSGVVQTRGRIAALLELGAGFHPDLTGRENVFLNASLIGISRSETQLLFDEIVQFSGIGDFIDTQVKFYSSGMFVRLAFSVAIHAKPDILLVDEVLAVGDEAFQRQCLDKIREFQKEGRTIILVTHGLSTVTEFCDRAVLLDHGKLVFDGDPSEGVAMFRELLEERRLASLPESERPLHKSEIIKELVVTSKNHVPVTTFTPGQDLRVAVRLESARAGISDWNLRLSLVNSQGITAISANVRELGFKGKKLAGSQWVEFIFAQAQLGAGTYSVNLALESGHVALEQASHVGVFEVSPFAGAGGIVFTRPTVTVTKVT